jgi:hypothetical protein
MAIKMVSKKQGTATASILDKQTGTEVQTQEPVGPAKVLEGPTCTVGIEASMTINMGDYNSVRIGCSLQLPCEHGEIDEVFEFGKQWIDQKMQDLQPEAAGEG